LSLEKKFLGLKALLLPTPKFMDGLLFASLVFLTAILAIPFSCLKRVRIREAIFILLPKLMPKDILIEFYGVRFVARRGKTDILLLNRFSEPWMAYYFKPKKVML
jgi:hypothetical protein